jgi:putative heme-binding domain-containing protein
VAASAAECHSIRSAKADLTELFDVCDVVSWLLLAALVASGDDLPSPGLLGPQLRREDPAVLARDARRLGDPRQGAVVFYQPALACARCHLDQGTGAPGPLGPDLTALGNSVPDVHVVESILEPSKAITTGYETVTIVTDDGRAVTGLLAEDRPDAVVLRDPGQDRKPLTIVKSRIERRNTGGPSLMPDGLASALGSRQQFLDLARYVMEIAEGGPARARDLRPDSALLAPRLPEYERDLDHAGMIAGLGPENFRRGEAIYSRVCANCHGTTNQPGSLPTAPRFTAGTLKNGSDPFRMYRTLTDGFGQMAAQTWMVPRQKYDVIHYIREAYFRRHNSSQYFRVDGAYRGQLPKGTSRGPAPAAIEPWSAMDYGSSLSATYEIGDQGTNFAYKGIAVRLDPGHGGISRGRAWVVYDHDTLRLAAAWTGRGFIDWNGINFNGRHKVHPRAVGTVHVANLDGPGWGNPSNQSFSELRERGRDGRSYGPLPRGWARYKGLYRHGDRVIIAYTVGTAEILETPGLEFDLGSPDKPVFARTLDIGPSRDCLTMRVASKEVAVCVVGDDRVSLFGRDGSLFLRLPPSASSRVVKVLMSSGDPGALRAHARTSSVPARLEPLTHGGPRRWPEVLKTQPVKGAGDGPFAVDVLTVPEINPWLCEMRLSGFDFLPDGHRAAVCTWDGDVWLVDGIDEPGSGLAWRRIASGLFQPLGLKTVAGEIYVACRDQIVRLHDLNGDGEIDFYENFNSDHQVTEHFHEFAMGLQTDSAGNFYYAKAARHGLPALVPHHGTLLRVSKDGAHTEIVATGFRAPNGVCVNSDGTFFLSDQEGFWTPKNRINWVRLGRFYGNMWGYHEVDDASNSAMEPPVCWITNTMDRSPAELIWVESKNPGWEALRGSLLSLSYGNGKIFVVPHERIGDQMQGGVCALPLPPFPTGVMRGRFHPESGQLYVCGLFAWAGDRTQPGGFYRVRATGKPVLVPIGLSARRHALAITFSGLLDRNAACDSSRYAAKSWSLKRTADYGSAHYDERAPRITHATLSNDGRTVTLEIPELQPAWCMEVRFATRAPDGAPVEGLIHNTIHRCHD